ncbi:hypothetical protein FOL47_006827 [Perkinsus chesapeaki]|uniref:Uncharacterized protein n=1 Tax=Perkinsus chesapeaki TaxID=330153 RepID=A0A7J6MXF3_PERCH|nr:hypothetical protein FOL47_006827 [Perkinsus chesapeaki]
MAAAACSSSSTIVESHSPTEITEITEPAPGATVPSTVEQPSVQCQNIEEESAGSTAPSMASSDNVDVSDSRYYHDVAVLTDALIALVTWPVTFVCVFLPAPISNVVRSSTRPLVYRSTAVAKASARVMARALRTASTKESRVVVILCAELWLRVCALMTTKEMRELGDTFYRLTLAIIQVLRTRNVEDLLESVKDLTGSTVELIGQTSNDVKKIIDGEKSERKQVKQLTAKPTSTEPPTDEQSVPAPTSDNGVNEISSNKISESIFTFQVDLRSPLTISVIVLLATVWLYGFLKLLQTI